MQELLGSPLIKGALGLIALLVLLKLAHKLFFPPRTDAMHLKVRCAACGWRGTVGKYMKRCSRCNAEAIEVLK